MTSANREQEKDGGSGLEEALAWAGMLIASPKDYGIEEGPAKPHLETLALFIRRYQAQAPAIEALIEAVEKIVKAFDLCDEQGMFSDHGENHEAGHSCPGCQFDIASEDCREALAAVRGGSK